MPVTGLVIKMPSIRYINGTRETSGVFIFVTLMLKNNVMTLLNLVPSKKV